jgi:RimK family alpha-L-glutamate ligase
MKNKQIIALTMSPIQSQFEVDRLEEEALKMGIKVKRAMYREMVFDLKNGGSRVSVTGEEITAENTMGCWFRVAGTKSGKYTEGRNMLIRILQKKGIYCVNGGGYLNWTRMGKIAQHALYIVEGIPVIPTRIFYQKNQVRDFLDWGYPVIAKHERGYQGRSVRKFENWEEVEKFLNKINEKNLGMFLWQKYLPTKWDLRVIVIGGKAIGAMKRTAVGKEFRSNYSLGGKVEKWELSETERELAEKVAKVSGLDYCGVDIMKDEEGNNYVLEVNRQCQFQGFEKATGINVAKAVVEMILKMT